MRGPAWLLARRLGHPPHPVWDQGTGVVTGEAVYFLGWPGIRGTMVPSLERHPLMRRLPPSTIQFKAPLSPRPPGPWAEHGRTQLA